MGNITVLHSICGKDEGKVRNKEILSSSPGKLCGEIKGGINKKMWLAMAGEELSGCMGGNLRRDGPEDKFHSVFHWSVF